MKLFRGNEGFYDLISEAKKGEVTFNNYNTTSSEYVTTIYETDTHEYKVVENIDLGVFYSVEKIEKPQLSFVEKEIIRLEKKQAEEGLDIDEHESLIEYKGRQQSIEWERAYLNGERGM